MKATIQSAQQTWQSPDGQRKLYTVTYTDESGNLVTSKTWSGKIGTGSGQQFDLEVYTKDGNRGPEQFVRQVQQEGSQYASQGATGNSRPNSSSSDKQFKGDPDTRASIERQTGLKAAVEVVANYYNTVGVTVDKDKFTLEQYAEDIVKYAKVFGEAASAVPAAIAEAFPGATAVNPSDYPAADVPFSSPTDAKPQHDSLV